MRQRTLLLGSAIAFGTFRLLVTQRVLTEGGQPVRVGSRALEILFALLEHPGEILSKARLIQRVWPDVVVEEGALRVHIELCATWRWAAGNAAAPSGASEQTIADVRSALVWALSVHGDACLGVHLIAHSAPEAAMWVSRFQAPVRSSARI